MTKVICGDCRYENEPERVYCHNCGTRLNRSMVAQQKSEPKQEDPAETQKRLQRMINPRGAKLRHNAIQIIKLVVGALGAAILVLIVLPPPDVPPQQASTELGPQIGLDLELAVTDHRGATLTYNEDQVSAYLANTLKRKRKDLDQPLLPFEKAFVRFDEGVFRLTEERSFFGYPLYAGTSYKVSLHDGALVADTCGGTLGRIRIHPGIMKYTGAIFADVWKALDQDRKKIAKLQSIEFHPKTVLLTAPVQ